MNYLNLLLLFIGLTAFSQKPIEIHFIKSTKIETATQLQVDSFGSIYFLRDNVLHKISNNKTITFNNLQLGNVFSLHTFNPLKINIFYKDFNTLIVLDNRLTEIFKIDFNTLPDFKNVSQIATGFDNTIWIFNQNSQTLELFDYKTRTTRLKTVPIPNKIMDVTSNFNFCWLLTKNFIYKYNYFGSLIQKIKNNGYTSFIENNDSIILKKDNHLFLMKKNSKKIQPINTKNIIINEYFVSNESLYIYNGKTLNEFQLKVN